MLTRLLAFLAVLLLAPSAQLHANARVLSLENARLGFFSPNSDFLKEISDLTHCCIKEKTTEQAESSNRREEYLRARYMDPTQGRFLGMDPWVGRVYDPFSLHKYQYSKQAPASFVDPSGLMTLGDVGAAVNSIANLTLRAVSVYTNFIEPFAVSDESETPTVWDALMSVAISAIGTSFTTAPASLLSGAAAGGGTASAGGSSGGGGSNEKHHSIPVYLCGHATDQPLSDMPRATHSTIHAQLDLMTHTINVLGRAITFTLRRSSRRAVRYPFVVYATRTKGGRGTVLTLLTTFYVNNGFMSAGSPTVATALATYGPKYVAKRTQTSWPVCRR